MNPGWLVMAIGVSKSSQFQFCDFLLGIVANQEDTGGLCIPWQQILGHQANQFRCVACLGNSIADLVQKSGF
jgi:hypothetical protein